MSALWSISTQSAKNVLHQCYIRQSVEMTRKLGIQLLCLVLNYIILYTVTFSMVIVYDWGGLSMWNVRIEMTPCRNVVGLGWDVRVYRGRKTWGECVKDVMVELGWHPEWAVFRYMWRGLISGKTSNPSWSWKKLRFKNKWWLCTNYSIRSKAQLWSNLTNTLPI